MLEAPVSAKCPEERLLEGVVCPLGPEPARSVPPAPLAVETLCGAEAFERLAPCWNRLVDRARIGHPFLTLEWARSFWEAFGAGARLRIVTVRCAACGVARPLHFRLVRPSVH